MLMARNAAGRYIPSIEPDSGASTKILTDAPLRPETDYPVHDRRQRRRSGKRYIHNQAIYRPGHPGKLPR
ncbi:hypothetical protein GSH05_16690 [Burkholderia pseudomallei]|uniref:Uncharacterized protein n=3 Tax=pseudomallei group TaxID=111527 RepID=A0AAX1XD98_BURML|nr:hypothetical protein BMAA1546 [Burkholderia mallei ATCC 23344]AUL60959.1 hypothetical protein BHT10_36305 [Burkholderia pseudomallei]PNX03788.1 hypothetical protein CF649_11470 [Burkholderia sp. 136(2017)]PNX15812.1 hypothetical protein CF650_10265 [Burkholderia sp. 129]PNX30293.1 hypothetical protein CF647_11515 [Burkholderia sp. 117]PNX39317.1 hypothetical protein CF648_11470 [Burkholderia sp. 137]RKN95895.1 hypothetical protein D8O31_18715 [Burkholderia mallei]